VQAIDEVTAELPARDEKAPLRLPVDRVFTITGFGTIATGTLMAGTIKNGMTVEILPAERTARVRQIEVHGEIVEKAVAGQRTAVNLSGIEKEALLRGSVVAAPGSLQATYMIDAKLKLLASASRALKNMTRVHIYLGTGRSVGRVVLLERDELRPGGEAFVQLRLEKKLVAQNKDRFIIRSFSPMFTIGGGVVLDATPEKHKRFRKDVLQRLKELEKGDPAASLLQRIRRESITDKNILLKQAGLAPDLIQAQIHKLLEQGAIRQVGDLLLDALAVEEWQELIERMLADYHRQHHLAIGMPRAELKKVLPPVVSAKVYDWLLDEMAREGCLQLQDNLVFLTTHRPEPTAKEAQQMKEMLKLYFAAGFMPPTVKEIAAKLQITPAEVDLFVDYLARQGELVRLDEQLAFHRDYFQKAKDELCRHFQQQQTLTAGEFREKLGSTRKYIIPLLETFDRLKWTRRSGDHRVAWRLDFNNNGGDQGHDG
ncbi:MAG: selenocysteine-specific translation elongation factor, partial [Firmicutes bacterium]|nr:selenocysteine-specific translation elongation factor [Bacillota bacterium]